MACPSGVHQRPTNHLTVAAVAALASVTIGCYPADSSICPSTSTAQTFAVSAENATRHTAVGDLIAYDLFTPQPNELIATPPYPAVVISHGFARDKEYHRNTACTLAERGIVVLTPNLVSLLGGEEAQLRNIDNLVDHVRWLRYRTADETDALCGLLDADRIALVGHSSGGAIAFEAAIDLADAGEDVSALVLLDGVPWTRTVQRAAELRDVPFASIRSEPTPCNAEGAILQILENLSFQTDDILVVGGSHCDPENPTDLLCSLACGGSNTQARAAYQDLLYAFLHDALQMPDTAVSTTYPDTVERLHSTARIVTAPVGTNPD